MLRNFIFIVLGISFCASAQAEVLPWHEQKPAEAPAAPAAKFFPINVAALMRPPRNAYGMVAAKAPAPVATEKPAVSTLRDEAAQKLLEIYPN